MEAGHVEKPTRRIAGRFLYGDHDLDQFRHYLLNRRRRTKGTGPIINGPAPVAVEPETGKRVSAIGRRQEKFDIAPRSTRASARPAQRPVLLFDAENMA